MSRYCTWDDSCDTSDITELAGKTLAEVRQEGYEEIHFITTDGVKYVMFHQQDCCEHVSVESVVGNLQDLVGSPILKAEERSEDDATQNRDDDESGTWTFYTLATIKGYVDIRWYGSSNGYYSESVDFVRLK